MVSCQPVSFICRGRTTGSLRRRKAPFLVRRYIAAEWFDRERDRVFDSQWFAVGRVEEIPEPGDHVVCDVGAESVIVTRLRDGGLAAYINLCRHRGSQLTDVPGKPSQEAIGPSGKFKGTHTRRKARRWSGDVSGLIDDQGTTDYRSTS